jgi:hypothetical protein
LIVRASSAVDADPDHTALEPSHSEISGLAVPDIKQRAPEARHNSLPPSRAEAWRL